MEPKRAPYNEKKFLLALLKEYVEENGHEIQNLENYKFSAISLAPLSQKIRELLVEKNGVSSSNINYWVQEAAARGHVTQNNSANFSFKKAGYEKALEYKHPIKTIHRAHAQKIYIATLVAIIGALIKLISG
jgi:hypothetical protein